MSKRTAKSDTIVAIPSQGQGAPFVNEDEAVIRVNIMDGNVKRQYQLNHEFPDKYEAYRGRKVVAAAGQIDLANWTLVSETVIEAETSNEPFVF